MKKLLILISFVFLIITIYSISVSFGVFESSYSDDSEMDIAKWNIKVNDDNLNNTNNVFYVNNITYTNSNNVSANRFAPGVTGSFLLVIDPCDTEVSFKYELSIDLSDNEYDQITVDSIEGINNTNLTVENGVYSRVFTLSEIIANKVDTIKVTFSWDNDEANNDSDSVLGSSDGNFEFPLNIKFTQYVE